MKVQTLTNPEMRFKHLVFGLALSLGLGTIAAAQTPSIVHRGDTILLVVKQSTCTTACPDSILRTWAVYGQRYSKVVKAKTTDTIRIARSGTPANAQLFTTPYKSTVKTVAIPEMRITLTNSKGVKIPGISMVEFDSVRAVSEWVYPDGSVTRIPTTMPMTWTVPTASPFLKLRVAGGVRKDTLWMVATGCGCRRTGRVEAPPTLQQGAYGFAFYELRDGVTWTLSDNRP